MNGMENMRLRVVTPIILALISVVVTTVLASNEPSGFRDFDWDSSSDNLKQKLPRANEITDSIDSSANYRRFEVNDSIGDIPVTIRFYFLADKLQAVELEFLMQYYKQLTMIFKEKYGPAPESKYGILWKGGQTTVLLSPNQYLKPANGYATITKTGWAYLGWRRQEEIRRAAGKL